MDPTLVHVNVKSPVGPHKFSGTFSVNQNLFKFREGYEFFQEIVTAEKHTAVEEELCQ